MQTKSWLESTKERDCMEDLGLVRRTGSCGLESSGPDLGQVACSCMQSDGPLISIS